MVQQHVSNDNNAFINPQNTQNEGIEILVAMAKNGRINPWNIDIVDITDKYLTHLFEMKSQNLKPMGKTLWLAAVLLKLKSNILEGVELVDFEGNAPLDELEYSDDFDEYGEPDYSQVNRNVTIDNVLERRTSVRLNRNRVVTLRDLIRQLEFYEMLERKQTLKNAHERAQRRVRSYARLTPEDIVNLAHDEYIEKSVETLKANLEEILSREDKIELNELTLLGMDRISAYIALLFLAVNTDYELVQDEFYSDLYVTRSGMVK